MNQPFDASKMDKLPPERNFFDINSCWYFPNRWAVKQLYPTSVTANHVTWAALVSGLISATFYFFGGRDGWTMGAVFLYGKLFLDNVDGNLARVRREVSRLGRFLDSFSDFVVTALVYLAVTHTLAQSYGSHWWPLGLLALLSAFMQCSYWVFYYVQYADHAQSYQTNRVDESVTEEDLKAVESGAESRAVLWLQQFHHMAYGWQDKLIALFDAFSRKCAGVVTDENQARWHTGKPFMVLVGPLCVCSNTFGFVVCSIFGWMDIFFLAVLVAGNAYLMFLQIWKIKNYCKGSPEKATQ